MMDVEDENLILMNDGWEVDWNNDRFQKLKDQLVKLKTDCQSGEFTEGQMNEKKYDWRILANEANVSKLSQGRLLIDALWNTESKNPAEASSASSIVDQVWKSMSTTFSDLTEDIQEYLKKRVYRSLGYTT